MQLLLGVQLRVLIAGDNVRFEDTYICMYIHIAHTAEMLVIVAQTTPLSTSAKYLIPQSLASIVHYLQR